MLPHLHAAPHLHPTPQLQSDQGHLPEAFGGEGEDGVSAVSGRQLGRAGGWPRLGKRHEIVRDEARIGRNGLGTSSREPRGRRRGLSGHAPGADTDALLPLLLPEPPKRLPNIVVVWLPRFAMASARNG